MKIIFIVFILVFFGYSPNGFCTLVAEKKGLTSIIEKIKKEEGLSSISVDRREATSGKYSISFKSPQATSMEEARKLLVEVMEKFRQGFNDRWELYSRVEGGSLDTKNVEITIYFEDTTSANPLHHVTHKDGRVYYYFSNVEEEEDYGEALQKVYGIPFDLARKLITNVSKN